MMLDINEIILFLKKFKIIKFIIFFIVIFLVLLFVFDLIMKKIVHKSPEVVVPMVQNMKYDEAKKILDKLGLVCRLDREVYSKKIPADKVIMQFPEPNSIVRKGKIIKLVVSKGGESIEVPSVLGVAVRVAEITLTNAGAIIGQEEYVYSLSVPEESVVRQNPKPNELIGKGGFVSLQISKGLPPDNIKLMPNLEGLFLETAEDVLTNYDIYFSVNYIDIDDASKHDIVLKQTPSSDEVLDENSKAIIEVGKFSNHENN